MRPFLLFTICTLLLLACNSNSNPSDATAAPKPLDRDSLGRVYRQIMQAEPELMPASQIIEVGKLYPVDAGQTDTSFFVFRENLLRIIEQRNEFKLLEAVAQNVASDAPGENTLAAFVEYWKLDSQKDNSELWLVLENILTQGGAFNADRQQFTAPFYVATFPGSYEAEVFGAITGEGVRMRETPDLNSRILKTISYDIVQVLEYSDKTETISGETHPWVKVKLTDGKEGFIYGKYVGRPNDRAAVFTRQPGERWLLTALRAGS